MLLSKKIQDIIYKSILTLRKEKKIPYFPIPKIEVEANLQSSYGDYSSNILFTLSKKSHLSLNDLTRLISPILSLKINEAKFLDNFAIKNGFINFFISRDYLTKTLFQAIKEGDKFGSNKTGKGKTIIVEYSSPNIAKSFGIGHLRSTIIGQAIYNIYKFSGWKCISDNHIGDWGTQFGKLIYEIKEILKNKNQKEKIYFLKNLNTEKLEKLYINFHKKETQDKSLDEEARKYFSLLEKGDKEARTIWQYCKKVSLREFERIYKILGVKFDYELGESFYTKMVKMVVKEVIKKGLAHKSEGALVVEYPKNILPSLVLIKSDGSTTYFARDLATIKYRIKKWHPNIIVYEVGAEQSLYFKQLFELVRLLGWSDKTLFVHIGHGLYRTKQGKFSTRKGQTIHLKAVLEEAIKKAGQIIEESKEEKISEDEKNKVAKIVGIGAVKYNDLSQSYAKDIIFDWSKILNLKGDSGPYIQYTYARAKNIIRKSGLSKKYLSQKIDFSKMEFNDMELALMRLISKFPNVIQKAALDFSPNLICRFIFNLSQKYNSFYDKYPVLQSPDINQKKFRLILTLSVSQILKTSLSLLGIATPERM